MKNIPFQLSFFYAKVTYLIFIYSQTVFLSDCHLLLQSVICKNINEVNFKFSDFNSSNIPIHTNLSVGLIIFDL